MAYDLKLREWYASTGGALRWLRYRIFAIAWLGVRRVLFVPAQLQRDCAAAREGPCLLEPATRQCHLLLPPAPFGRPIFLRSLADRFGGRLTVSAGLLLWIHARRVGSDGVPLKAPA